MALPLGLSPLHASEMALSLGFSPLHGSFSALRMRSLAFGRRPPARSLACRVNKREQMCVERTANIREVLLPSAVLPSMRGARSSCAPAPAGSQVNLLQQHQLIAGIPPGLDQKDGWSQEGDVREIIPVVVTSHILNDPVHPAISAIRQVPNTALKHLQRLGGHLVSCFRCSLTLKWFEVLKLGLLVLLCEMLIPGTVWATPPPGGLPSGAQWSTIIGVVAGAVGAAATLFAAFFGGGFFPRLLKPKVKSATEDPQKQSEMQVLATGLENLQKSFEDSQSS